MQPELSAQSKMGFENYNYLGQGSDGAIVPMVSFETKNNWHAEIRYNYDEVNTISFYAGKTFSGGKDFAFSITPMAGFAAGDFTGYSLATNIDLEWKNFYASTQSQYSIGAGKEMGSFFFNWSELGYTISKNLFAGLAIQYTLEKGENIKEPGLMAGLSFGNLSLPVYVFQPFGNERYWVVGLTYELNLTRKKK
jgi:hypothetical protein